MVIVRGVVIYMVISVEVNNTSIISDELIIETFKAVDILNSGALV